MHIHFEKTGTPAGLNSCLQRMVSDETISGLLVLTCENNGFLPAAIDPILRSVPLPLAGGVFPRIIHDGRLHERGTMVIGLSGVMGVETICGLSDRQVDYETVLDQRIRQAAGIRTMVVLVDGFASRIEPFIESLFNVFGLGLNYVGGGAGSLVRMQRTPCLLTNHGMVEDCAVLAFLSTPSGIGVCHGYEELAGPFQVTQATDNMIETIEWQPAFDFYRQVLSENLDIVLTAEDFYTVAQHHPFGIARLNGEQIVREPYMATENGSLLCIGEIREGTFISVLRTSEERLIGAAAESLRRSLQSLPDRSGHGWCLFVDCVSRTIALGERFQHEIDTVSATGLPLVGICSIGEIANCGEEYLDLYNKTAVIAVLDEP